MCGIWHLAFVCVHFVSSSAIEHFLAIVIVVVVFFCQLSEFSALLLNTDSGLVESVFHHFVRPVHFPELSEYCIRCTGFTQSFIDQQKTFADVYNKFLSWLRQHIVKRSLVFATPRNVQSPNGLNATFCSWSDWDLGHYLYRDCIRNEAQRYECMKAWIDIRRAFDVSIAFFFLPFSLAQAPIFQIRLYFV